MADRVNRRASAASYRSSGHRDASPDSNVDVFSDDFAIGGSAVADGFRPMQPSATREFAPRPTTPPRTNKPPANDESKTDIQRRMRGQSSSQGAIARNSFSLQHDASDTPQRIPSMHQSDISRRISTISSTSTAIPRTQSPYVGASAPSHPYGMYPQDTQLNRASTISSIRPSRPAHPYGMYPQGTTAEAEASPLAASADITSVGFPGLGQRYARRLGPDGEDADDIIGPDGHTEQLPPYTRYPDGVPPKERPVSAIQEAYAPGSPQTSEANSPTGTGRGLLAATGGAGGAGIVEGTNGAGAGAPQSMTNGSQGSHGSEEHLRSKEKWVARGKERTCFGRLPVWAVALIIGAIVIIAAVVGALIGRLVPNGGPHHGLPPNMITTGLDEPESTTVWVALTTTMIDAEPLTTTPTSLPPLPTGNFGIPVNPATESSSSCLESNPDLQMAWGCLMGGYMSFNVSYSSDDNPEATLDMAWPIKARGLQYGPQAPKLKHPAGLALMQDANNHALGPAFYFCQDYDKLVILPEMTINTSTTSKRSVSSQSLEARGGGPEHGALMPGQKPWFCWWNSTYLEGFIYLQQDSTANLHNVSNIISSMTQETPAPSQGAATTQVLAAATTPAPTYRKDRRDDGFEDGDDGHPYYRGAYHHKEEEKEEDGDDDGGDGDDHFGLPAAFPQVYPKAVKLEERRIADKKYVPYCEQMQVLDNWSVNYVTYQDPQGATKRVSVQIDEMSPPQRRAVYENARLKHPHRRRDSSSDDSNGCRCEWMSS